MKSMKIAMSFFIILSVPIFFSVCFGAENSSNPMVVIETSKGNITVELYKDKAPKTVENFLEYVNAGYYNGTIFHRVIQGFMIQGGGFTEAMVEKSGLRDPIVNESSNGLKNDIGTIAMARTDKMDSATSQFFINTRNNGGADSGFAYAVFGKVKKGMNVVYKIEGVETGNSGFHQNVPTKPVIIKAIYLKTE